MPKTIYLHQVKPHSTECTTTKFTEDKHPFMFSTAFRHFHVDSVAYSPEKGYYTYSYCPSPLEFLSFLVKEWKLDLTKKEKLIEELIVKADTSKEQLHRFESILKTEEEKAAKTVYLYRFNEGTGELTVEETKTTNVHNPVCATVTEYDSEYQMCSLEKDNKKFINNVIKYLWFKYQNTDITSEDFSAFSKVMKTLTGALESADTAVKPYVNPDTTPEENTDT